RDDGRALARIFLDKEDLVVELVARLPEREWLLRATSAEDGLQSIALDEHLNEVPRPEDCLIGVLVLGPDAHTREIRNVAQLAAELRPNTLVLLLHYGDSDLGPVDRRRQKGVSRRDGPNDQRRERNGPAVVAEQIDKSDEIEFLIYLNWRGLPQH